MSTITGYRHSATCTCGCHLVVGAKGRRREDDDTPRLAAMGGAVYEFPASTDRGPVDVYYERRRNRPTHPPDDLGTDAPTDEETR